MNLLLYSTYLWNMGHINHKCDKGKLETCNIKTHWDIIDLKRLWCWEGLGAGREGDDRGGDGWMASLTRWMWVWVNSGSWWWTGKPGVLRFMGSQRVRHNWATELNMTLFSKQSTRNPRSLFLPCLGLSAISRASFLDMLLLQLPGALHSDGPRASINGLLIHSCLEILNHFWMRDSGFHFSFDLTNGWSWPLTSYFSEFQKRQQSSSVWSSESQQSWLETESSTFTLTSVILNQGKFAP